MKMSHALQNLADTRALAKKITPLLEEGDIVKFTGSLGAGKTTFIRYLVEALGGDPSIVHSPTFSLMHQYPTEKINVIHCDFYRLDAGNNLEDFGGLEFFDQPFLYLIEWPEKIRLWNSIIPERLIDVNLQSNENGRICEISSTKIILD